MMKELTKIIILVLLFSILKLSFITIGFLVGYVVGYDMALDNTELLNDHLYDLCARCSL